MNFSKNLYLFFEKIIEYFLPVVCFLLPIAFYLRTYDSCQIKITIVQIGGVFFFAIWLLKTLERQNSVKVFKEFYKNKLLIPVIFFLLSGVLSYILSPFEGSSGEEIVKRLLYIATFFVVVFEFDSLKKIERFIFWILLANFITSLYGIIQYLELDPFAWKGAFGGRIFSTFGNPNFFSAYLVWTIPIILSYIMLTKKWSYSIVVLASAFCVFCSQSKASWIGLTFGVIVFTFLSIRFFSHFKQESLKKVMAIGVIIFLIVSSFGVWFLIKKRVDSVNFRVSTWHATWDMINKPIFVSPIKSKILGTGIGTFKTVYPAYRRPEIFHIEGKHNTETDHPENELLEIWYDEGIVGFGIFLWMLFLIYFASLYKISYVSKTVGSIQKKNLTKEQKQDITLQHYLVGLIAGLSGMLLHNTMCVNMRFVSSGFFFWIILGLIIAVIKVYESNNENNENLKFESEKKGFNITSLLKRLIQLVIIFLVIFFIRQAINLFKADYYHNVGISYSKAERWDGALEGYRKAYQLNKKYIMTYYFSGNVFLDRWDMEKKYNPNWGDTNNIPRTDAERSLAMYDKVKSLAPNYVQTHFQVGMIYFKLKEYDKAIENYEKYLKLDPVFPHTYLQIGSIYIEQKNWQKAEEIYNKALEQDPKFYLTYFNMGNMWYFRQDMEKAKQAFAKAVECNPQYLQAYKNLVFLYVNTKEFDKAKQFAKKMLELSPNDEYAKNLLNQLGNK
jgi:tetratricopeptide (TPR) repeat protein